MPAHRPEPAPVRLALQALDALRAQDPALAAQVAKSLPAFALKQAKAGTEVTVKGLIAAAHLPDFGQTTDTTPKADLLTRYQQIARNAEPAKPVFQREYHTALTAAAWHGDTQEVARLLHAGKEEPTGLTLQIAAERGHTEIVTLLLEHNAALASIGAFNSALSFFCTLDIIRLLVAHSGDIPAPHHNAIARAAAAGRKDVLCMLLDEFGADINANHAYVLTKACSNGRLGIVTELFARGIDMACNIDITNNALIETIRQGHNDILCLLIERGCDVSHPRYVRGAVDNSHFDTAVILLDHGAPADMLDTEEHRQVKRMRDNVTRWQRTARMAPPKGLAASCALAFKPRVFEQLRTICALEGYHATIGNIYAYQAMALFQTEDRIVQYLQKWNPHSPQPLHDIIQMVNLPDDLNGADLKAWGDAVLRHGPRMARMARFCNRLRRPLASGDGKTWSYSKTRAEVARYAYARAAEHPALAVLCFENMTDEKAFETALELAKKRCPPKNMPEITIDGVHFGMAGSVFKKLANDDIRGLFLGDLTGCCQSIGGHGHDCATHGFTSPHGGFYAIETAKGEIIGQSWAWRGSEGELCLDSLETLGKRVSTEQWKKLVIAFADALSRDNPHNVTALHIGTGGKTPPSLSDAFDTASAKPKDYKGYRDSRAQIRVWKR